MGPITKASWMIPYTIVAVSI